LFSFDYTVKVWFFFEINGGNCKTTAMERPQRAFLDFIGGFSVNFHFQCMSRYAHR